MSPIPTYKFENLEVWHLALAFSDTISQLCRSFPQEEKFNLCSQASRAATSIALNIAEGSTSQSDLEQSRFIGFSIRSTLEVVACIHIARLRGYIDEEHFSKAYSESHKLFAKLQAFRTAISKGPNDNM